MGHPPLSLSWMALDLLSRIVHLDLRPLGQSGSRRWLTSRQRRRSPGFGRYLIMSHGTSPRLPHLLTHSLKMPRFPPQREPAPQHPLQVLASTLSHPTRARPPAGQVRQRVDIVARRERRRQARTREACSISHRQKLSQPQSTVVG